MRDRLQMPKSIVFGRLYLDYNGQTVDIDASYERMKKNGKFNEHKLVFKQVKPNIHLYDFPPAPMYKGNPEKPMVSFIINVAWGNEYLSGHACNLKKTSCKSYLFSGRQMGTKISRVG